MKIAEVTFRIVGRTPLAPRFRSHAIKPAPPEAQLPGEPALFSDSAVFLASLVPFRDRWRFGQVVAALDAMCESRRRSEVTFVIRGTRPLVYAKFPRKTGCIFPADKDPK